MPTPDFMFLNNQAVKITSLRSGDDGDFTVVLIARGGADKDQLLDLLNADDLSVRLDTKEARHMLTTDLDVRSTGDGPQAIHRIEASLVPANIEALEENDQIIDRLDRIVTLLTDIRDRMDR